MDDFAGFGFEETGMCGSMLMCGGVRRGARLGGGSPGTNGQSRVGSYGAAVQRREQEEEQHCGCIQYSLQWGKAKTKGHSGVIRRLVDCECSLLRP